LSAFRIPEEISAIVYTKSNNQLPIADVISILKQPDMDKVSNIPPQHPKGGQVFLISDGNNKARQNNWTCDGYPWVNKGGKCSKRIFLAADGLILGEALHFFNID
jgi:hypothetical protein